MYGFKVEMTALLHKSVVAQWGEEGVDVKGKHYRLVRLHFMDQAAPQSDSPSVSMEGMGDTALTLLNGTV